MTARSIFVGQYVRCLFRGPSCERQSREQRRLFVRQRERLRSIVRPQFNGLGGVPGSLALPLPACCTHLDKSGETQETQFLAVSGPERNVR
jgi:hypothetical protein